MIRDISPDDYIAACASFPFDERAFSIITARASRQIASSREPRNIFDFRQIFAMHSTSASIKCRRISPFAPSIFRFAPPDDAGHDVDFCSRFRFHIISIFRISLPRVASAFGNIWITHAAFTYPPARIASVKVICSMFFPEDMIIW